MEIENKSKLKILYYFDLKAYRNIHILIKIWNISHIFLIHTSYFLKNIFHIKILKPHTFKTTCSEEKWATQKIELNETECDSFRDEFSSRIQVLKNFAIRNT